MRRRAYGSFSREAFFISSEITTDWKRRMDLAQIIGFAAGFGTTFAAMPDLIAMLNRRSSADMNPRMAAITGTFQILWVIYGALIGSRNIIMWNVIAVLANYLTVGAYMYFRRKEAPS
jgi:uncharacterized protein with PQ loop repeat